MRSSRIGEEPAERCASHDLDAGRCQLIAHHGGPHAVATGAAYLTWDFGETYHWSISKPPLWVVDLSWAGGWQPRVPPYDS
jgi:hypothetical protein